MVNLRSNTTAAAAIDESAARSLQNGLTGGLIRPGDGAYDSLRKVFNAMIDRHPAIIIRCANANDVAIGVRFARNRDLPLSVRGGGHSVAGSAICEGGVMLDLSGMKEIRVDPDARVAVSEPGLTLGEFDRETQRFGLATPLGIVSVTGIAGLTLGGGLGWLNGKYGLACDNLLAADVVTAEGERVLASTSENADLFWALRGGGGNFGVVTSMTYQLHEVGPVLAGGITFAPEGAREAMRFYHEFASTSPDELAMAGALGKSDDGRPVFSVAVCYCGEHADGERVLKPLRDSGMSIEDTICSMDYCTFQRGPDAGFPEGRQHYWKSGYLKRLSDEAIEVMLDFAARMPSAYTGIGLQQMTGMASRVQPDATAFPHRARQHDMLILSQWDDPADSARNIQWTREFFEAMTPHLETGVYANNLGDEGDDRVRAAYGVNYQRLAAIKAKYDPMNVFRMNQNIQPAPGQGNAGRAG